jgi:hypothetical protein
VTFAVGWCHAFKKKAHMRIPVKDFQRNKNLKTSRRGFRSSATANTALKVTANRGRKMADRVRSRASSPRSESAGELRSGMQGRIGSLRAEPGCPLFSVTWRFPS